MSLPDAPPWATPVTVAVMSDHELVACGVRAMMRPFSHRVRVTTGPRCAGGPVADVALHDVLSLNSRGYGLDEAIAEGHARRVLLYTLGDEPKHVEAAALQRGIAGVVSRAQGARGLLDAIERVHHGQGAACLGAVPDESSGAAVGSRSGRQDGLSAREAEIVTFIAQGLSNADIAGRLFLSINTVKTYIRSAYRRMDVDSRSRAVLWAVDHDLVRPWERSLVAADAREGSRSRRGRVGPAPEVGDHRAGHVAQA